MSGTKPMFKIGNSGQDNDDIWDDRLLIKAYDESIQLQRAEVAKRIANATNKSKKQQKPSSNDNESVEMNENGTAPSLNKIFKNGDFVRATYDADGIDYEAEIISIEDDGDNISEADCRIKFVGYNNEQAVKIADLMTSWGSAERTKQTAEAAELASNEDMASDADNGYFEQGQKSRRARVAYNGFEGPMIPPPPPMPPMLNDLTEDSEHLSAMLMAWYMSGYYTGLYQGHKLAKQHKAQKNSCKRK